MSFIVDKQTWDDLRIFGRQQENSLYGIFNVTHTRGGALVLEDMFRYPWSEADRINHRSGVIRYFMEKQADFPFQGEWLDAAEYYLDNTDERSRITVGQNTFQRKLKGYIGGDMEYEQLHKGVVSLLSIANHLSEFLEQTKATAAESPYRAEGMEIMQSLHGEPLGWMLKEKGVKKIPYDKMTDYDRILRYEQRGQLKKLLAYIYRLDVYISVASVARRQKMVFATALPPSENILRIEQMYHPALTEPVANSLQVDRQSNVIFLTGANMAGKSTFMKTFGICIYLAHMGFPVPAREMLFSVRSGLYTTINLPDNLNMGYSHFYAEVLRVKKVALQVNRTENLIIIFDELFRGTNVKDAYDATVAITEALAGKQNCLFMISTHIIEAGEELQKQCNNINFVYLPTVMKGKKPTYTYTLQTGITNDRHGMMIIRNEGIMDILNKGKCAKSPFEQREASPANR